MAAPESLNETVAQLLAELKAARAEFAGGDDERSKSITELRTKVAKMEGALDGLSRRLGRPGNGHDLDAGSEREQAVGLLQFKHLMRQPKHDPGGSPIIIDEKAIEEATLAVRGARHLFKTTDIGSLPIDQRKALTSFNVGASGFILPPEMSSRVLSCLVDPTDIAGLMSNITISGPSIKFLVDNANLDKATWACDVDCWGATHIQNVTAGLGELELKPESLRYIICTSRDILEDASDIENWMLTKVNRAMRATISDALIAGDGIGKPQGILNPSTGIPICATGPLTPAGQFTWQDLIMLKWQVPVQFHGAGSAYLMNQNTFGLTLTMSDANGRPIRIANPTEGGQYLLNGSPVRLATQMPDPVPGATPVAFGNWNEAYMVVNRKAVTMQQDPYSAGFCTLFKFESRVGGGVVCANAARLLRLQ
jgi:HK97 family phage major capsid protein